MSKKIDTILRHETLFGKLTPLQDASHIAKDRKTATDIRIFKISNVLQPNSIFIGFGKPNVFVGYTDNQEIKKFDAKSIKRQESKIVNTKDWAQSGLIIEIKSPTDEMKHRLKKAAESFEGSRYWTCVNANARVLNRAGFTSNGKDLSDFYFPMSLAKQIVRNGLEFENEKVEFTIIKTVPNYLESFGVSVVKSQWMTFYRHFSRFYKAKAKDNKLLTQLNALKHKIQDKIFGKEKKLVLEESVVVFPETKTFRENIELTITTPSKLGLGIRMICGPHAYYEIKHSNEKINDLLPEQLKEYKAKTSGFFTNIKKNVLFSKPVVQFIRKHLANTKEEYKDSTEKDLYNMIRTDSLAIPNKYNLIITSDSIYVIKIGIKYKIVDWILSKHVLLSGYSDDVRFAGEFWKGQDGVVYFNNNSGTYAPSNDLMDNAKTVLQQVFPNTEIDYKSF